MNRDPLDAKILAQAIALAEDIENDFVSRSGGPIAFIVTQAKTEAAAALKLMIETPPGDVETIRSLQNEVRRFQDIVAWLRQAVVAGDEAYAQLDE